MNENEWLSPPDEYDYREERERLTKQEFEDYLLQINLHDKYLTIEEYEALKTKESQNE